MPVLLYHDDALADLETLTEDDAAMVIVALEEAEADPAFLDKMFRAHTWHQGPPSMNTDRLYSYWNDGLNLLRLKIWDFDDQLCPYRVIYAYDGRVEHYHILGIMHRSVGYASTDPLFRRIVAAYEALGLPAV